MESIQKLICNLLALLRRIRALTKYSASPDKRDKYVNEIIPEEIEIIFIVLKTAEIISYLLTGHTP
jgi:hypothetical protein